MTKKNEIGIKKEIIEQIIEFIKEINKIKKLNKKSNKKSKLIINILKNILIKEKKIFLNKEINNKKKELRKLYNQPLSSFSQTQTKIINIKNIIEKLSIKSIKLEDELKKNKI